jgi:diguanylate cyclase (GGDEF)-like protein
LDFNVITTALFSANSTASLGAINCLVIMVLALIQSRIIEQHANTLVIFAIAMLFAGLSLFGFVAIRGDSRPLLITFSCFGILTFACGMASFLSLYGKTHLIKYAAPLVAAGILGLFAFPEIRWIAAWTIVSEGVLSLSIAILAFKQKDKESPVAKFVVVILSLFLAGATAPWLLSVSKWVFLDTDSLPSISSFEQIILGLSWAITPTIFYAALVVAINVRFANILKSQALIDPLTGLANRRALYSQIENSPLAEEKPVGYAVMLLDIDHFKVINDTYGHLVGDQVLIHCAKILTAAIRPQDLISRYGGEEFCVVAKGITKTQAIHLSERLCNSLRSRPMPYGDLEIKTTVSVGVVYHDQIDSLQRIIGQADNALYSAKASGRDKICIAQT